MNTSNAGTLSRSFLWLNVAQFLGALNDNIFKLFAMFFIIALRGPADAARIMGIGGIAFVLPFLLFSAGAGVLADRHSKRTIIVIAKAMEILVMVAGVFAFVSRNDWALYAVIFLMSTQSALFGPSKYSIVPELVSRDQLSRANSLLVMFTYLAIIAGSVAAPFLAQILNRNYVLAQWSCVAIAAVGFWAALRIHPTPAMGTTRALTVRFVSDIWRTLKSIRPDGYLFLAVLASAYFTALGAFMQLNIIPYGMHHLGLTQENSSYLFFLAAVGIACGALAAGRMSGRNIELGIVPLGAIILTAAVLALRGMTRLTGVLPAVFFAGLGAGMFIVPLDAFIQFRAPADRRGEVLAASAFLSWVGVLVASGLVYLMGVLKMDAATGFLVLGLLTLVLTIAALKVLPDFLVRFIGVVVTRMLYRVRVLCAENVPIEGGALLVCNHVSWVDALLLLATQQRRIRFLMERSIYETPVLRPLFRLLGLIPISMSDSPKRVLASLKTARAALDEGFLVCIFAEGAITRSGMMHGFRAGFEHIVKDSAHPIIPVYIGGAWGSIFSFYYGRPLSHWPTMLRYPVAILFGQPLPASATAAEVRENVMELSCDYYNDKKPTRPSLGEALVLAARQNWRRRALADTTGKSLTFGEMLTASVALAEKLRNLTANEPMVGLLLPPTVGGVLANTAVTLLGKTPVNLNYTASDESFRHAAEQCGLQHILT